MNTEGLELPICLRAIFVDDMREVVYYEISWDAIIVRWDTIIDGEQKHIALEIPFSFKNQATQAERWIADKRAIAKAQFVACEDYDRKSRETHRSEYRRLTTVANG